MIPISLYVTAEVVKSFQAALIEVPFAFMCCIILHASHTLPRLIGQFIFPSPTRPRSAEPRILPKSLAKWSTYLATRRALSRKTLWSSRSALSVASSTARASLRLSAPSLSRITRYAERCIRALAGPALVDANFLVLQVLPDEPPPPPGMDPGFNFVDDRIIFGAWKEQPTARLIKEFLVLLGVCHSVQIESETVDGVARTRFAASSPDEAALVFGAANLGCRFVKRDGKVTTVSMDGVLEHFEVMADNEFNSTRKRQSLLVKRPNGTFILFCKGADTVIYDRLAATSGDTCVLFYYFIAYCAPLCVQNCDRLVLQV